MSWEPLARAVVRPKKQSDVGVSVVRVRNRKRLRILMTDDVGSRLCATGKRVRAYVGTEAEAGRLLLVADADGDHEVFCRRIGDTANWFCEVAGGMPGVPDAPTGRLDVGFHLGGDRLVVMLPWGTDAARDRAEPGTERETQREQMPAAESQPGGFSPAPSPSAGTGGDADRQFIDVPEPGPAPEAPVLVTHAEPEAPKPRPAVRRAAPVAALRKGAMFHLREDCDDPRYLHESGVAMTRDKRYFWRGTEAQLAFVRRTSALAKFMVEVVAQ